MSYDYSLRIQPKMAVQHNLMLYYHTCPFTQALSLSTFLPLATNPLAGVYYFRNDLKVTTCQECSRSVWQGGPVTYNHPQPHRQACTCTCTTCINAHIYTHIHTHMMPTHPHTCTQKRTSTHANTYAYTPAHVHNARM